MLNQVSNRIWRSRRKKWTWWIYTQQVVGFANTDLGNDQAKVRYIAMLEDGTVFEKKGFDGETTLNLITDEEQVIGGLERGVATMKKGEQAILTIGHEYGYGSQEVKCDLAVIPPFSTILYEVKMIKFEKEKAPWEMVVHERVEAAGTKKEEGNILYKSGKYQRAAKKYDKAMDYVSEEGQFGDDDQKLIKSLRVSCWLNGAACSLKLNDYKNAITTHIGKHWKQTIRTHIWSSLKVFGRNFHRFWNI